MENFFKISQKVVEISQLLNFQDSGHMQSWILVCIWDDACRVLGHVCLHGKIWLESLQ